MTNPNYTHLLLVVDRSGSMSLIADDMNGGIHTLLEQQRDEPGELFIDAWSFDDRAVQVWENVSADEALSKHPLVVPRGSTALYDAIGKAVTTLGADLADMVDENDRPGKVVVVIVTDGEENSSRGWTADAVKALVTQQTDTYGWDFVFLGANIDSFAVGDALGVPMANSMNYAPTGAGASNVFASTSSYLTSTRSGLAASFSDADRDAAMES